MRKQTPSVAHRYVDFKSTCSALLMFDNRITQHYAVDNYDNLPRRLNRVTVAGDVPAAVDGRRSRQLVGDASHYSSVLEVAA